MTSEAAWYSEVDPSHSAPHHSPWTKPMPMQFFREIRDYVGFTSADEDHLFSMHDLMAPHFEEIVDAFYEALEQNPRTRMIFSGEAQIERLHQTLLVWLERIFSGPFDEDYFWQRRRIGQVHVDVGLLPHFMFGAMNVIRRRIVHVLLAAGYEREREEACLCAVERILDLELTIMVQSYWDVMMAQKLQVPTALATGLAHEIRNPLNALNLNVTLMERRLRALDSDTSSIDGVLEVMRSEIRRIRGLTSEIMDFAKPIQVTRAWHDGQELLREISTMLVPTFEVSRIAFHAQIEGGSQIWCDLDRIKQILVNLITNAVEAIGESGHITLSLINSESGTKIVVQDDGEGMTPEQRHKIFDLFYTTKAAGTGLGLPIVRKIIEAHDGAIDVVSHEQRGTTFTIYLPKPYLQDVKSRSETRES